MINNNDNNDKEEIAIASMTLVRPKKFFFSKIRQKSIFFSADKKNIS